MRLRFRVNHVSVGYVFAQRVAAELGPVAPIHTAPGMLLCRPSAARLQGDRANDALAAPAPAAGACAALEYGGLKELRGARERDLPLGRRTLSHLVREIAAWSLLAKEWRLAR